MRMFHQIAPLRTYMRGIRGEGKTVGFVPTMGALHEGHLTLIRRAKQECDLTLVSIFVNPLQFGANEDIAVYPRDLARDQQLTSREDVDALFVPEADEMYPAGAQTIVDVPDLGALLEGAHRPGHFRGVATVVTKLLSIVRPDRAYFGQKDFQQLLIVDRLVRDLNLVTSVIPVPTVREADGLAMSSRNAYLSPDERKAATVLYRGLMRAEEMVKAGETGAARVQSEVEGLIRSEPLVAVDYVALANPETLQPTTTLSESPTLLALAVRIGKTRLIDNALLSPAGIVNAFHRPSK